MRLLNFSLFFVAIALSACGPKLEEKKRTAVEVASGPTVQEAVLKSFADQKFADDNLTQREGIVDLLKQTEMMLAISSQTNNTDWQQKATKAYLNAEDKATTKRVDYNNSTYLDLVYTQIRGEVSSSIKDADKEIAADTIRVITMIRKEQHDNLSLTLESSLTEKLQVAQKFLDTLIANVKKMDIIAEFKDTFSSELKDQSHQLLGDAVALDENLSHSETLTAGLGIITAFIKKSATTLDDGDRASLDLGLQLAGVLDTLTDAKAGLQALALVWSLLDDQQRIDYFKSANEELYKFFSDRSADDIRCLTEKNCKGLKNFLVLHIGVYPAVEKFGFKNIVDLINQKGMQFLMTKVNHVAYGSLQKIGETITDQVLASVSDKRNDLGQFKDNLREHLSTGLEQELTRQKIRNTRALLVDAQKLTLDFDTQTTHIRNKIKVLPLLSVTTDKAKRQQLQFEIVESIASLPLFSKAPDSEAKTIQKDLAPLILNPEPRQYLTSPGSSKGEVNLNQQSSLLLTTSFALSELADWKSTAFDSGITQITADQILTQFKSDSLKKSFFSKGDLISIVLSVASETLKLMQSRYSAVVLVNNENQILPVQNLNDSGSTVVLAAATDFKAGQRVPTVKASDLSLFLMAMVQFYNATEGIEQTHSEFLKKSIDGKPSLLTELLEARQSIKLLIIATANFISNQLIQPNGLVSKSIALNENLKPLEKYELLDQTRAVEALVRAYQITKLDVYLWTAQNIYRSMNRNLYSETMRFYQQSTENQIQTGVDATQLLETYKNLLELKPYLDSKEQFQFDEIFDAWLKS